MQKKRAKYHYFWRRSELAVPDGERGACLMAGAVVPMMPAGGNRARKRQLRRRTAVCCAERRFPRSAKALPYLSNRDDVLEA